MAKTYDRTPDYRVSVLNKATQQRGAVGGAWLNDDDTITVVLNPCVVLPSDPDLVITMFPVESVPSKAVKKKKPYTGTNPFAGLDS